MGDNRGQGGEMGDNGEQGGEMPTERIFDDEVFEVEDDEPENEEIPDTYVPGPLVPLREELEKDKDDESLTRWKEKLLGCVEEELNGQMEPEVTFHSIGIVSEDLEEMNTPLPIDAHQSNPILFTLREGSVYRMKLTFTVKNNIVSGLAYSNSIWRGQFQVVQRKGMLGTFAPQREPYEDTLKEETTPSGELARGVYTAKLKFEDDDRRCHLELDYSFEIKEHT